MNKSIEKAEREKERVLFMAGNKIINAMVARAKKKNALLSDELIKLPAKSSPPISITQQTLNFETCPVKETPQSPAISPPT